MSCRKSFKNSRSLASHKHRYHPYLSKKIAKNDDEISSVISDISSISSLVETSDSVLDMKNNDNKIDEKYIKWEFDDLKKRLDYLESKFRFHCITVKTKNQEGGLIKKNEEYPKVIQSIQDQSELNRKEIQLLRNHIEEMIKNSENEDSEDWKNDHSDSASLNADDLIDEMIEIKDLFIAKNFEELKTNISGLKQAIMLMLSANIGSSVLSTEELSLLKNILQSSEFRGKMILKNNFPQLVYIFKKLIGEFNSIYEADEFTHNESNEDEDFSNEALSSDEYDNEENEDVETSDEESEDQEGDDEESNDDEREESTNVTRNTKSYL